MFQKSLVKYALGLRTMYMIAPINNGKKTPNSNRFLFFIIQHLLTTLLFY